MPKADRIEKHHQKILTEFQRLIEKWKPIVGLPRHDITVSPYEGEDDAYLANVNTSSWQYHNALIDLHMNEVDRLMKIGEWDMEQTVVHELMHIVLAPGIHSFTDLINHMTSPSNRAITDTLYDAANKTYESTCETLANAFLAIKRDK